MAVLVGAENDSQPAIASLRCGTTIIPSQKTNTVIYVQGFDTFKQAYFLISSQYNLSGFEEK